MVLTCEDDGAKSLRVVSRKVLWLILLQQTDRHQNLGFNLVLGSGCLSVTVVDVGRFEVFEQRLEEFIELQTFFPNVFSAADETLQLAESVHFECSCSHSGNAAVEDAALEVRVLDPVRIAKSSRCAFDVNPFSVVEW